MSNDWVSGASGINPPHSQHATEPVGGELGEAVERCEGIAAHMHEAQWSGILHGIGCIDTITGDPEAIRKVCQAVRQLLAEKRLSQGLVGKWVFNEQQAEQPEELREAVERLDGVEDSLFNTRELPGGMTPRGIAKDIRAVLRALREAQYHEGTVHRLERTDCPKCGHTILQPQAEQPEELREAVEFLDGLVEVAEHTAGVDRKSAAIHTVLRALEQQAEQPEADPELGRPPRSTNVPSIHPLIGGRIERGETDAALDEHDD